MDHRIDRRIDVDEVPRSDRTQNGCAEHRALPNFQERHGTANDIGHDLNIRTVLGPAPCHAQLLDAPQKVTIEGLDHEAQLAGAPLQERTNQTRPVVMQAQAQETTARGHRIVGRDLAGEEGVKDRPAAAGWRGHGLFDDQVIGIRTCLPSTFHFRLAKVVAPPAQAASDGKGAAL